MPSSSEKSWWGCLTRCGVAASSHDSSSLHVSLYHDAEYQQVCVLKVGMRHACVHRGHLRTRFLVLKPLTEETMSFNLGHLRNLTSKFFLSRWLYGWMQTASCWYLDCLDLIWLIHQERWEAELQVIRNCHSLLWDSRMSFLRPCMNDYSAKFAY